MGLRNWIAKVLRIQPYSIIGTLKSIDQDVDYRNTGKTTMRIKAACNHCHNNPKNGRVVILTSTEVMAKDIRLMVREICPEYAERIEVTTPNRRRIGKRPTKIINDLFEV